MLICLIPDTCSTLEVIKAVIVEPMKLLEAGIQLKIKGETTKFIGSIFSIIGMYAYQTNIVTVL